MRCSDISGMFSCTQQGVQGCTGMEGSLLRRTGKSSHYTRDKPSQHLPAHPVPADIPSVCPHTALGTHAAEPVRVQGQGGGGCHIPLTVSGICGSLLPLTGVWRGMWNLGSEMLMNLTHAHCKQNKIKDACKLLKSLDHSPISVSYILGCTQ